MTSFSESRLELFPTKWQVTVSFDTLILENGGGAEMRYSRIVEPRFTFSASDMILTKDEYDYLKAFFEARKGKFEGFRFTNPLDYQTSAAEVELATDITTQGILIETATAGEYQLVKRYTVAGVNCYKTIRKVKEVISGPSIDLNSGIATSGGSVSCEYDLMVRFNQDEIELTHITIESAEYGSVDAYRVVGLQLVEDNYPKVYGYVESDFSDLEFTFVPSPLPEVTKGTNTVTRIEVSQSQKETRISFSEGKAIYKFGQNFLYQPEVDVFYTLFLACMGRKKAFTYDGVGVRFSSDQLTLNLEVVDGNYAVWQMSGLEVVATEPFIGPPPPPPPPPPPVTEHIEDFTFSGPENDILYSFTFASTNPAVPPTAQIYLVRGIWDSQGTLGTFTTPDVPPENAGYGYNWTPLPVGVIDGSGPEILIGTGNSVSGTVIEDESDPGPFQSAGCSVRLRFDWS